MKGQFRSPLSGRGRSILFWLFWPFFLSLHAEGLPAAETPRKWSLSIESGTGSLASIQASYLLYDRFDLGAGTGFDTSRFSVGGSDYMSFLVNLNLFAAYRISVSEASEIQIRIKGGTDFLKVGPADTACLEAVPEILIGDAKGFFILSGLILFTQSVSFLPQIGAGYRFRF